MYGHEMLHPKTSTWTQFKFPVTKQRVERSFVMKELGLFIERTERFIYTSLIGRKREGLFGVS